MHQRPVSIPTVEFLNYSCSRGVLRRAAPSLFALALEPLAIFIQGSGSIEGLMVGSLEKKISLYADDTPLHLHDANSFLRAALEVFDEFG